MSLVSHASQMDNPHQLTLDDLGYQRLQNYALASRAEILALNRHDRYIDAVASEAHVKEAFLNYLEDLGLLIQGKLPTPVRDVSYKINAWLNVDGRLYIEGAVEETTYMRYVLRKNGTRVQTGEKHYPVAFNFAHDYPFETRESYELGFYFYPTSNSMLPSAVATVDVFDEFRMIDQGRIRDIALDLGENT